LFWKNCIVCRITIISVLDGGNGGRTTGGAAFFASAAAILSGKALTSPSKAMALSRHNLMSRDGHAMAAPVGGTNEDGDGGSSRSAWGSTAEYEDCAMAGLRGVAHGDGDGEPSRDTDRLAVGLIDQNPS
jgi:hypothetical protein